MTLYKPWSFNVASLIMYALAPEVDAGILFNGGSAPKSRLLNRLSSESSIILFQSISAAMASAAFGVASCIRNLLN